MCGCSDSDSRYLVSVVVSLVLYLNIDRITVALFQTSPATNLLRLFVLTIPVSVGVTVGVSALRGIEENTRYKLYTKDLLYPCPRILLLVALVAGCLASLRSAPFISPPCSARSSWSISLSNRLVSLVGPVRTHTRELLSYSAPLIVTMVLSILLTRMDTIMLAEFRTSNEVGVYNAAYPLANSLLMVISSFGYLYLPLTSRLDADGERDLDDGHLPASRRSGFTSSPSPRFWCSPSSRTTSSRFSSGRGLRGRCHRPRNPLGRLLHQRGEQAGTGRRSPRSATPRRRYWGSIF